MRHWEEKKLKYLIDLIWSCGIDWLGKLIFCQERCSVFNSNPGEMRRENIFTDEVRSWCISQSFLLQLSPLRPVSALTLANIGSLRWRWRWKKEALWGNTNSSCLQVSGLRPLITPPSKKSNILPLLQSGRSSNYISILLPCLVKKINNHSISCLYARWTLIRPIVGIIRHKTRAHQKYLSGAH